MAWQTIVPKELIKGGRVGAVAEGELAHLADDGGEDLGQQAPFDDRLDGDPHVGFVEGFP